ncbi:organomercurial lyase [Rhodococcus koreensis]
MSSPIATLTEDLRLEIYGQLTSSGSVEDRDHLAARLGVPRAMVDDGLTRLHTSRDLALGDDGEIVLAHPFATRNFGYAVMGENTLWWGGCAWDAFAIPHLVPTEPSTLISTRCPACDTPHAWNVTRDACTEGSQVVYFATPMNRVWDNVIHACSNQRIFCSDTCIDAYHHRNQASADGFRFDVPTLWHLASHWYEGRLDRGYQRRDPESAASYFRQVGLIGDFWGNI